LRAPRLVVVAVAIAIASGCASRRAPLPHDAAGAPCRLLDGAFDGAVETPLAWHEVTDPTSRLAMAESCQVVGPAIYRALPAASTEPLPRTDVLTVVSWNIHVGGGDLGLFIDTLREGRLTNGQPVDAFVILVQEGFRRGRLVPDLGREAPAIPRRIAPSPPGGLRQDIVETARSRGLSVFYLPSMRNGSEEGPAAEDRGNAILSTFPLAELTGIELPFERQRRIAAAATIAALDTSGSRWRIRVVSAHLNATASMRRLWVFAAAARARQARHLAQALAGDPAPTIVGVDLNTWAGGWSEPAFGKLRAHFPQTINPADASGFGQRRMLDYVFLRTPASWSGTLTAIDNRFGSDHRPVVARIELSGGCAQSRLSRS
jgi:endonuclease/exonuclease/phosphatase family metal-dependent hydrolase